MMYCLFLYSRMLYNRWCNPDVFKEVTDQNPLQYQNDRVQHHAKIQLGRGYGHVPTYIEAIYHRQRSYNLFDSS